MLRAAWIVIVSHLVVNVVHAAAHLALGLVPTPLAIVYIALVIYLAPVAAALELRRGRVRAGMALLAAAMVGTLVFATYHHFLVVSPDHVAHVPAGAWALPFQVTAILAEPIAALGAVIGGIGAAHRPG